jgi:hypothetical protein
MACACSAGGTSPGSCTKSGEMRRQELPGSVQCSARFVENWIKGLEDMRHPGGDIEGDLDVGAGGLPREAEGVVEEKIVTLIDIANTPASDNTSASY